MGVWIETYYKNHMVYYEGVTPCMGVWIETYPRQNNANNF